RWVWRRPAEEMYEVGVLGRLPLGVLRWWCERVLALEFEASRSTTGDAVQQLHARTGGIPLLVRHAMSLLLARNPEGGFNVSTEELQEVFRGLDAGLADLAQQLRPGGPAWAALERREVEILHMIATISR